MMDVNDYASTVRGIAIFALDSWKRESDRVARDDADEMIRCGRMQALACVLKLITGRSPSMDLSIVEDVVYGIR